MKLVYLDPPGALCLHDAIFHMLNDIPAQSFVELGCGRGVLAYKLCQRGLAGMGIDSSPEALRHTETLLQPYLQSGQFSLHQGDLLDHAHWASYAGKFDLALSMMVMEHVEDDIEFLRQLCGFVKNGGQVMIAVPGRKDRWGIEDETAGHLRRYEREELTEKLQAVGLTQLKVWSVAVPVANILLFAGNFLLRRSEEMQKRTWQKTEQTQQSGLQRIPFKTIFPSWCKFLLNPGVWAPAFLLQRFFYNSRRGLILLGRGMVTHLPTEKGSLPDRPAKPGSIAVFT